MARVNFNFARTGCSIGKDSIPNQMISPTRPKSSVRENNAIKGTLFREIQGPRRPVSYTGISSVQIWLIITNTLFLQQLVVAN